MTFAPRVVKAREGLERKPFELGDHAEMADRLVTILRSNAPIVFAEGQVWKYSETKHVFEALDLAMLSQIVQRFSGAPIGRGDKSKPLKIRATDVGGAIRLACDQASDPKFFENAPKGIVFENGFVEVTPERTELKSHSADNRARFSYPFSFDAAATPSRLLQFFDEVFRDDEDAHQKIMLLQEYVGTAMIGLCARYHKALVLLGDGRNGKGVFSMVTEAAMPPGSVVAIAPQEFSNEYRKAMLAGKLLNIVSELPEAEILDSESFKSVVAGDSTTGREIRQAPFTFRPVAGHIYSANRLPGTQDQSHGFWSRLVLVQFNRVFLEHEQNPELANEIIRDELPAVVSWFLAGAQRVQVLRRFTIPATSADGITAWRHRADQVLGFIEERCERLDVAAAHTSWTTAETAYRSYRNWAQDNGHRALASNSFGERMRLLGLAAHRTKLARLYPISLKGPCNE